MSRVLHILIALFVSLVISFSTEAQLVWKETTRIVNVPAVNDPAITDGVELYVQDGVIIVRTNHKVQIRIFTILGQLVSQSTLNAGTSELKIASRGIYIIKIGNITHKIAL